VAVPRIAVVLALVVFAAAVAAIVADPSLDDTSFTAADLADPGYSLVPVLAGAILSAAIPALLWPRHSWMLAVPLALAAVTLLASPGPGELGAQARLTLPPIPEDFGFLQDYAGLLDPEAAAAAIEAVLGDRGLGDPRGVLGTDGPANSLVQIIVDEGVDAAMELAVSEGLMDSFDLIVMEYDH
jgi:hypothetical protein